MSGFFLKKGNRLPIAIWFLCAFYRWEMITIPSKRLEKRYGVRGEESSHEISDSAVKEVNRIARNIERVASKTPWQSKCLVRARVAQYLLHRIGVTSTMYMGVGKDEGGNMIAHAWTRCGDIFVTGGNGEGYAVVAKFSK